MRLLGDVAGLDELEAHLRTDGVASSALFRGALNGAQTVQEATGRQTGRRLRP